MADNRKYAFYILYWQYGFKQYVNVFFGGCGKCYLAYLIPFVSFFVIYIMNQRFLKEIYYLNPYHWFLIEDYLSHEKLQMWGMLFLMYLGWNGLFADRVVRRLNGE